MHRSQRVTRFTDHDRTISVAKGGVAGRIDERADAISPLTSDDHKLNLVGVGADVIQSVALNAFRGDIQIGEAALPFGQSALSLGLHIGMHLGWRQHSYRSASLPGHLQAALQHGTAVRGAVDLDDHRAAVVAVGTVRPHDHYGAVCRSRESRGGRADAPLCGVLESSRPDAEHGRGAGRVQQCLHRSYYKDLTLDSDGPLGRLHSSHGFAHRGRGSGHFGRPVARIDHPLGGWLDHFNQLQGTAIGDSYAQRMPWRFNGTDVGIGDSGRPALVLPLRATDTVAGVLVALRPEGAQPFSVGELDLMTAFADQAALAWQLASTQHRISELSILTDRERIARDLHDHVIQRLFAVGLSLQGTIARARSGAVQQRLSDAVDDLQAVIQDIRTTIFDLNDGSSGITRLKQRVDEAVGAFPGLGVRTSVQYIGPLSVVDATLADHAEAVVREAVSNAVRHANSTALTVTISVDDDLTIEVKDNGRGMAADITGSGVTNLRRRAEDVGGSFSVLAVPDGGTHLIWRAPLP